MDAYQSIMARRSVRSYKKEMPPKNLVMKVVGRRSSCTKRNEHSEMAFHCGNEQREDKRDR